MGWPVIITSKARKDLRKIVRYIAKDYPPSAVKVGDRLIDVALRIGDFPEMGRRVPEFFEEGLREMIEGNYRIVYELLNYLSNHIHTEILAWCAWTSPALRLDGE